MFAIPDSTAFAGLRLLAYCILSGWITAQRQTILFICHFHGEKHSTSEDDLNCSTVLSQVRGQYPLEASVSNDSGSVNAFVEVSPNSGSAFARIATWPRAMVSRIVSRPDSDIQ